MNILAKQWDKNLSEAAEEEITDWCSLNGICWAASISSGAHQFEISYRDHSLVSGDEALLGFVFEDTKLAMWKSESALVGAAKRWLLKYGLSSPGTQRRHITEKLLEA